MLSSSGTEDDSTGEESDLDRPKTDTRIKGENLKTFNQKQSASKFKPMGFEGERSRSPSKATVTSPAIRVDEEGQESPAQQEQAELAEKKTTSGIAAAGFKAFVGKKSISIKIKGSEGMGEAENSISVETRLLKENNYISKKRSESSFVELKSKADEEATDAEKRARKFLELN